MATRRQCEGFRKSFCLPKQSDTFLVRSYCFREAKMPDVTVDHTKKSRRRHDQTRCLHDGFTKSKMDSRIQYEYAPSRGLPGIFRHAKDFAPLTKLLPEPEKVHRRPYDGLRCTHEWPGVSTNRAECENFYHRVSILCQLRDSVTPALTKF